MKYLQMSDALVNFYDKHCQARQYSFSVLKCSEPGCQFQKVPRLYQKRYSRKYITFLTQLILAADELHCKPFPDVYGTPTTE